MSMDPSAVKVIQRAMWSSGDYPDLARYIESVSEGLVERAGAGAGDDVLDVATGTGNLALAAARRGASVTGLDLTPELLEVARKRASDEELEIQFVEGDAEELPFADGSFDHALSVFGTIFAPRAEVAAGELVRVARPGGTVGFCAWTPEGINGRLFAIVGEHMQPPPGAPQPLRWGDEDEARALFAPLGVELEFERRMAVFEAESVEAWTTYGEEVLGPLVMAKAALAPQGKWEALRNDLVSLYERTNSATDGTLRAEAEYLQAIGRVPG